MTDKRDAVVKAARMLVGAIDEGSEPVLSLALVKRALAALDSPLPWFWEEAPTGWSLVSPSGREHGFVNGDASPWAKFSWSARRSSGTLWGDSLKGSPAPDLRTAQSEVERHVFSRPPAGALSFEADHKAQPPQDETDT